MADTGHLHDLVSQSYGPQDPAEIEVRFQGPWKRAAADPLVHCGVQGRHNGPAHPAVCSQPGVPDPSKVVQAGSEEAHLEAS